MASHFSCRSPAIAVVGDRALTDVVYGNSNGMLTIFVTDIVTEKGDNVFAAAVCTRVSAYRYRQGSYRVDADSPTGVSVGAMVTKARIPASSTSRIMLSYGQGIHPATVIYTLKYVNRVEPN